ncbi:glycosyltransferase family 4 protein [Flavihumibacter sp. R14]|nr:glycosyltransferase family 4 protein [Flavihumibacter soli]
MIYILFAFIFLLLELLYFYIADRYNIIDHPNERSSHSEVTLRGGGIIFPVAILCYSLYAGFEYHNLLLGLLCISFISFWDDIHTASSKLRIVFHLMAVTFLFFELRLFQLPIWVVVVSYVLVIGTINAYNFMDGINGITGIYSLALVATLFWINQSEGFINGDILIITMVALLVFLYFNFRRKARCFAGDVGSVSMAFIVIFSLLLLILKTNEFLYILLLAVYGVDAVLTIFIRLFKGENIFEAHRSHAYQKLSNERGLSHRLVAFLYAVLQIIVNFLVIYVISQNYSVLFEVGFAIVLLLALSLLYAYARAYGNSYSVSS